MKSRMIFAISNTTDCTKEFFAFGNKDGLPWPQNKDDMAWFRQYTRDSTICCSAKTAATLPESVFTTEGRSLFILKRGMTYYDLPENPVIIGGAKIIEHWHSLVDEIAITMLDGNYDADVHLPFEVLSDIAYTRYSVLHKKINNGSITIYR